MQKSQQMFALQKEQAMNMCIFGQSFGHTYLVQIVTLNKNERTCSDGILKKQPEKVGMTANYTTLHLRITIHASFDTFKLQMQLVKCQRMQ